MIINFGLSDTAFGEDHYPVRRRGEKRRLNPNLAGIAWLDRRAAEVTATTETRVMSDTGTILPKNFEGAFILTRVYPRPRVDNHLRPMFQTFNIDGWSATGTYTDPCPDCFNMAYSDSRCKRGHGSAQGWRVPQAPSPSSFFRTVVGEYINLQRLLPEPPPITNSLRRDLAAWADSQGLTVAPEFEGES